MNKVYTESEMIASVTQGLFVLTNDITEQNLMLSNIKDLIPCFVHLNNLSTIALEYIDLDVPSHFPITEEDVDRDGMEALKRMCHSGDLAKNTEAITSFFSSSAPDDVMSFFERLKKRGGGEYEFDLYHTVTKQYNETQCIALTLPVSNLHHISDKISGILDEHAFLKKNFERYASLTKQEKNILKLLATGYNNPQISEKLYISRRTVENHRKHINKKLGLKSFAHLIKYAQAFNLI